MRENRINTLKKIFFSTNKTFLIALILVVSLAFASPYFLTTANLLNVLRQISVSAVVAIGYTLVLGMGEIDLSVGSLLGLLGAIIAKLMVDVGLPAYIAILCGLMLGAFFGALNATIITVFSIPPFIVTLATAAVFRGSLYIMTNMIPVVGLPENFVFIGQGYFLGIPVQVYVLIFILLGIYVIANRTKFGRYVVAKGANQEATRIAGISIIRVRFGVFMIAGICVAVASILQTGRAASAHTGAGLYMEMDVIAAVVIGGTALFGGNMNVIGTLFGVLIIGTIANGLNLLGINPNFQIIAKGIIILIALILDKSSRFLRPKSKI